MDIRLLGVVEVRRRGVPVAIPGTSARAVLTMLALRAGSVVYTDEIIEALWGRRFPHDPTAAVRVTVSKLRRSLGEERDRLRTVPGGYVLEVATEEVDVGRVEQALRRGRQLLEQGDAATAGDALSAALNEWRHDAPLAEFADLPFGSLEASKLLMLRCDVVEASNDASLARGRPLEVVDRTPGLIELDPWREHLVAQLMQAFGDTGRRGEGLAAYAACASRLRNDLGIEPSAALEGAKANLAGLGSPSTPRETAESPEEWLPVWFQGALKELDGEEEEPRLRARLELALGQAEHLAGLSGWQSTLHRAAETARSAGDLALTARCLIAGAPGWSVTAGAADCSRLERLQELHESGTLDDDTDARLLAAYANENCFASSLEERLAMSDRALEAARRTGKPTTLLAVLNQRFNAIWAPETLGVRRRDTAEACELAEWCGHLPAQAIATGFAMAAAVEAADIDAVDYHLDRFCELASRLQWPVFTWGAAAHASWRAVLAGDLQRAEEATEQAWIEGRRAGRPEADVVHNSQLIALRWLEGRLAEEVGTLESMAPRLPAFRATTALAHLHAGDAAKARQHLATAWDDGSLGSLPRDQLCLTGLCHWAEVAAETGSMEVRRWLYSSLLPFACHVTFTGAAVYGPVAHALALLAAAMGLDDAVVVHIDKARSVGAALRSSTFERHLTRIAQTDGRGARVTSISTGQGSSS